MSHSQYLRDLLRPLGIYDLEAPFNGGELDAQGEALDRGYGRPGGDPAGEQPDHGRELGTERCPGCFSGGQ